MSPAEPGFEAGGQRLAILLAMAMFVLVVDTSLMNVSIASVVEDLDTTVSGVQSAIALEALVSAAFILISSKVGDLIGRKRAYVLGLLGYAIGALAMALAQGLTAIIIFWAIIGGLGASLLLPAMQSLIHGNFEGAAQKKAYALVGAAAAIAAAVGPLLGGFVTTYLSWRVGFLLEVVVIAVVLGGLGLVTRRAVHRARAASTSSARCCRRVGMGGVVLGILVWQEGGEYVGAADRDRPRRARVARPLARAAQARGQADAARSRTCSGTTAFRLGISAQMLQNITLGGAMIALPIFLQMVLEYNALQTGLSLAPLSLTMFATALLAGKRAGRRRPAAIIRAGFALLTVGMLAAPPDRPARRLRLGARDPADRSPARGLGLLVSQLNNYTLVPDLRGAGQRGGRRELGGGLVRAVVRPRVRRRDHARDAVARVHQHGRGQHGAARRASRSRSPQALEDDAEVMSNTAARGAARRPAAGGPGGDHPPSTPTRGRSRCRSRCSCRSSPACSGCSTGSAMMRRPDPAPSAARGHGARVTRIPRRGLSAPSETGRLHGRRGSRGPALCAPPDTCHRSPE